MDEAKIYIKGKAGFKPAVKKRISGIWANHCSEINAETIMFVVPAEFQIKSFKTSLGEELIATYELQFLTTLNEDDSQTGGEEFFPMPMWSDKDSNVRRRTLQQPQHDPCLQVF